MTIGLQKSDLHKLENAIAAGRAKIDALDPDLRPDVRAARVIALRAEIVAQLDAINAEMAKRRTSAKDGLDYWSQEAVRRRAKFADDPALDAAQRVATFETLKRAATGELLGYLKDAIREKSVAKAEAVRLEFHSRSDSAKLGQEFAKLFAGVVDEKAKAMEVELAEIIGTADFGQVLLREFVQGTSLPVDRISAARAAGMARPVEQINPADRAAQLAA